MLKATKEIGGRGYSIAVWCSGLLAIVEILVVWGLFDEKLNGEEFTSMTTLFIMTIGAIGGVYQGQNIINALPGTRKWEGSPTNPPPASK